MKRTYGGALALPLLLLCSAAAHDAAAQTDAGPQKKLYCWTENGRKVCGDALPPEQAANARVEFSARSGRTLSRVDRAMTAEERAAAAAAAGQARVAADAEAMRVRRDLAMVESYQTEADLRRAFNERIVLVEESIKTSVLGEGNLRRGLVGLLDRAADLELGGKPVPVPLRTDIVSRHADLGRQQQILQAQRADRAALDKELAATLQRYHDLKAAAATASGTGLAER
jgi:hypothetical protein